MNTTDAALAGGVTGVVPSLWMGAYLFHMLPVPQLTMVWWMIPWMATVTALCFGVVFLFVVLGILLHTILS